MILNFLWGFIAGIIFSIFWVKIILNRVNLEQHLPRNSLFRRYHVHYSCFGLLLLAIVPFIAGKELLTFTIGIAIAIIVKHTSENDGFVFITKN